MPFGKICWEAEGHDSVAVKLHTCRDALMLYGGLVMALLCAQSLLVSIGHLLQMLPFHLYNNHVPVMPTCPFLVKQAALACCDTLHFAAQPVPNLLFRISVFSVCIMAWCILLQF